MLKVTTNLKQFKQQIDSASRLISRIDSIPDQASRYWPKIRERLRELLLANTENDEFLSDVPVSPKHTERKRREKFNTKYGYERMKGQGKLVVMSDANWHMTNNLKWQLLRRILNDKGTLDVSGNMVVMSLGVDVDGFVDDENTGTPYPLSVDQKIEERSGGEKGLVILTEEQKSEILEMLIVENEKLADKVMRGVRY